MPRKTGMSSPVIVFSVALGALLSVVLSLSSLHSTTTPDSWKRDQERTALYLPRGDALEAITIGYRNAFSNYLWFKTVNYFGKVYRRDRNYRWLAHMCELVTELNPRVTDVYQFCASMLAWELVEPERAIALLDRAIAHRPDEWWYFYLRGFFSMFFLEDDRAAKENWAAGAKIPGANPILERLAAKKMVELQSPEVAIEFLRTMLRTSGTEPERRAIQLRLDDAEYEYELERIDGALQRYREKFGEMTYEINDLRRAALWDGPENDPYGGRYVIDPYTEEGASTSGKKRLSRTMKRRAADRGYVKREEASP